MADTLTVTQLLAKLEGCKGAQFAGFRYVNKGPKWAGQIADLLLILGFSTEKLYEKDQEILKTLLAKYQAAGDQPLMVEACMALQDSRDDSLELGIGNNPRYTHQNTYVYPPELPGVRVHKETGELYINGLCEKKNILVPGVEPKPVKSKALTVAKNEIRALLPSKRFRQYILRNFLDVHMQGQVMVMKTITGPVVDAAFLSEVPAWVH